MVVSAVLVRPLAPVFALKEGKSNRDYIGHTCRITTGSVDEGFGQATLEDGGTVLQIPVRCDAGKLARRSLPQQQTSSLLLSSLKLLEHG